MHKSRLGGIVIDCQGNELREYSEFWAAALGHTAEPEGAQKESDYVQLASESVDISVLTQTVDHPSRVHLDIETDDLDAEVARLEKLGAKRLSTVKRWVVMEAPSGHRFCVVRGQGAGFEAKANHWD